MKRNLLIPALLAILLSVLCWADSHRVKFHTTVVVNGVEIEPGSYKLELNGENEAKIIRNGKVLVSSKVELRPLGDAHPGSISRKKDGTLTEIRLEEQTVVFIES